MKTAVLMKSVSMATHKNGAHVSIRDLSERSVKMTKLFFPDLKLVQFHVRRDVTSYYSLCV